MKQHGIELLTWAAQILNIYHPANLLLDKFFLDALVNDWLSAFACHSPSSMQRFEITKFYKETILATLIHLAFFKEQKLKAFRCITF